MTAVLMLHAYMLLKALGSEGAISRFKVTGEPLTTFAALNLVNVLGHDALGACTEERTSCVLYDIDIRNVFAAHRFLQHIHSEDVNSSHAYYYLQGVECQVREITAPFFLSCSRSQDLQDSICHLVIS